MPTYRGRFAPSPTGPLHLGSLVAAAGSYFEARRAGGTWLVRMEDLDRPREQPGAADAILAGLEQHGLGWDGPVVRQSARDALYRDALATLRLRGHTFDCACSRREIGDSLLGPDGTPIYPGTCRDGLPPGRAARAVRLRVGEAVIGLDDAVQGPQRQDLAREAGDFVLHRADGFFAYQLAVVVDDHEQGVTHVVRGADLLDSTPRQVLLQRLLGYTTPHYAHLPVAVNAAGEKLSKQTLAAPLEPVRAADNLVAALAFLGQAPPPGLAGAGVAGVHAWALAHWSLDRVPRRRTIATGQ